MSVRDVSSDRDADSGYASGCSTTSLPDVYFSKPHLKFINKQLSRLEPQDVLKWCMISLPNLYQTSAFGLTGLAIMDMVSKLDSPLQSDLELIFLDTLYHFSETLDLVERIKARYNSQIHIFKPVGAETTADFERIYGERLWETDEDRYDYVAKVEPAQRAYREMDVKAVLTGRRRSQGGKRGDLDIDSLRATVAAAGQHADSLEAAVQEVRTLG